MALKRFSGNPEYFYDTVEGTHELTDNDIIPFTHKPGTEDDEDGKVKLSELKKYTNTAQNERLDAIEGKIPTAATSANKLADKAYVDGLDSAMDSRVDALETNDTQQDSDIDAIQAVIPSDATSSNKLVSKAYVDDEISTNTATFRGNFATKAALDAYAGDKDNNDYAVVTEDETHSNQSWRYKYNGTAWSAEYKVNDTPLTQAQADALNSGITASDVTRLENVEAGAEVNVQADWNQTDSTADDYIKNKPTGLSVVDTVADGNMNAVTSNAVYDALQTVISGSMSWDGSILSITL